MALALAVPLWLLGRRWGELEGHTQALGGWSLLTSGSCVAWRGRSVIRQLWRGRFPRWRRLGAALVHLSPFLMALGVVGERTFKREWWVVLRPGGRITLGRYTLTYEGINAQATSMEHHFQATLRVERNGRPWTVLRPERNFHWNIGQWVTEVAIRPGLDEDLYLALVGLGEDGRASFHILVNPLMSWLWIGGALLLIGTVMSLWPGWSLDQH